MKKTLLLIVTVLSVSLFGCKKEASLTGEKSISQDKQSLLRGNPGYYDLVLYNVKHYGFNGASLSADGNYDHANVFMSFAHTTPDRWYIEYLDQYVKFWYQERGIFDKWRVLSINWDAETLTEAMNADLYEVHGIPNQAWQLIGTGDPKATSVSKGFRGVIVNKYNGKMLQTVVSGDGIVNVFVREKYKGSEHEKQFKATGRFDSTDSSLLWMIYRSSKNYQGMGGRGIL